ncbi:MAG: GNAT family N-acetyltransferase [Anaerolineae bacterium]|nr:GNAT family N-acetyltransferase [Anaerolineae bacterium]
MITTRPVNRHDIPELTTQFKRDESWARYISSKLRHPDTWIHVAEQNGRLAGYVDMRVIRQGQAGMPGRFRQGVRGLLGVPKLGGDDLIQPIRYGIIRDIFVCEPYRKQNVATRLLRDCIQELQNRHTSEIRAELSPGNCAALNLLRKHGFEPMSTLMHMRLDTQKKSYSSSIRPATQQDLPQLTELIRQEVLLQQQFAGCFQLASGVDWAAYTEVKLRNPNTEILVAEKNGQLTGYIDLQLIRPGENGSPSLLKAGKKRLKQLLPGNRNANTGQPPIGFIEDVFVKDSVRKTSLGLGVKLFRSGLEWFAAQGVREVQGTIWINNKNSLKVFQKLGSESVRLLMGTRVIDP